MIPQENYSLRQYNTFGIDAKARYFFQPVNLEELREALRWYRTPEGPLLILGGGSNILFSEDFPGTVICVGLTGISEEEPKDGRVLVTAAAGESWDGFVEYCVEKGYGGLENLSLIPGNVGSSPIQNIGAYGADVKEVIEEVHCIEISTGKKMNLTNENCHFDYRESVFKQELKGKVVVTEVVFRLWVTRSPGHQVTESPSHQITTTPKEPYKVRLDYGNIREELSRRGIVDATIRDVRDVICDIRRSKLPDPAMIGNAGSFFKNPRISGDHFDSLKERYPAMPGFPEPCGIKVPAGWLIEQRGWKGKRVGNAGIHDRQALVIVNYGGATGEEILSLAEAVRHDVLQTFGIGLEIEVNVI